MRKSLFFGLISGALSAIIASSFGYSRTNDIEWWLITLGLIIFLNVIYDFCKDDSI